MTVSTEDHNKCFDNESFSARKSSEGEAREEEERATHRAHLVTEFKAIEQEDSRAHNTMREQKI